MRSLSKLLVTKKLTLFCLHMFHINETKMNFENRAIALMKKKLYTKEFKLAPERFRNDQKFVLAAVQKNGYILKYVLENFKNDREIVLAAVQQYGLAIQFASEKIKNRIYAAGYDIIEVFPNFCLPEPEMCHADMQFARINSKTAVYSPSTDARVIDNMSKAGIKLYKGFIFSHLDK